MFILIIVRCYYNIQIINTKFGLVIMFCFIAVLWGTDLMEDSDSSRERYLRNLLREMLTYFSFLIITCICK